MNPAPTVVAPTLLPESADWVESRANGIGETVVAGTAKLADGTKVPVAWETADGGFTFSPPTILPLGGAMAGEASAVAADGSIAGTVF